MILQKELDFSCNLVKGKIAEIIFEQMIRAEKRYTVIPFGYEHTIPTLAQYQHLIEIKQVLKNISDAPDFVLISENKQEVFLVEIKYQNELNISLLKKYADNLLLRWDFAFLFVVTPRGFFCSMSEWIIDEEKINPLSEKWVSKERQEAYLKILSQFDKIPL